MSRPDDRERGVTLVELLVASALSLTIAAAVAGLTGPLYGALSAQPEMADVHQRLRVAVETLRRDLLMAGAGFDGVDAGALAYFTAPVRPYRMGAEGDDRQAGIHYRPDAVSMLFVASRAAQARVARVVRGAGAASIETRANCGAGVYDALCGFAPGTRALVAAAGRGVDVVSVDLVQRESRLLSVSGALTGDYEEERAVVAHAIASTYYLRADPASRTATLMRYDGAGTDSPVVDHVVGLAFEYLGDPQPPRLLDPSPSAGAPRTTYGPPPPALDEDRPGDAWGPGENCAFAVVDGRHVPRLASLASGMASIPLAPSMLTDGPWCVDGPGGRAYDADLLRIRRVRARIRVQAALPSLRGESGPLFTNGGTSTGANRFVPDHEIGVDVTLRNPGQGG